MNMKKRALLVTIVSTAVLGSTMLLWQGGSDVAHYTPRAENSAAGFAGAEGYYKMLRANVNTGEIEPRDILEVRKAYQSFASNQQKAAVGLDLVAARGLLRSIRTTPRKCTLEEYPADCGNHRTVRTLGAK
jgi:hypothetical protein